MLRQCTQATNLHVAAAIAVATIKTLSHLIWGNVAVILPGLSVPTLHRVLHAATKATATLRRTVRAHHLWLKLLLVRVVRWLELLLLVRVVCGLELLLLLELLVRIELRLTAVAAKAAAITLLLAKTTKAALLPTVAAKAALLRAVGALHLGLVVVHTAKAKAALLPAAK